MPPQQFHPTVSPRNPFFGYLAPIILLVLSAFLLGCASAPENQTQYIWQKAHGTAEERNEVLAAGNVAALQAYPDPISRDQITAEPINAPVIRQEKRNQLITDYMLAHGWHLVPQGNQ